MISRKCFLLPSTGRRSSRGAACPARARGLGPLDGFAIPAGWRLEAFPALLRLYRPVAASSASTEALARSGIPRTPASEEKRGFCDANPMGCAADSLLRRSATQLRICAKPAGRPVSSPAERRAALTRGRARAPAASGATAPPGGRTPGAGTPLAGLLGGSSRWSRTACPPAPHPPSALSAAKGRGT